MKHKFVSGISDGADATLVRPSNWNAVHLTGTTALSANTTLDATHDFVPVTTAASTITITLPAVSGNTGLTYTIMKADSGAGTVVITPNGAETINGDTTYTLKKQYETIEIVSNGTLWFVKDIRTGFSLASRTLITTTGSSTYTVPAGVKAILMQLQAGGGGGGGTGTASSTVGLGGGGGAGGYSEIFILAPTATYAVNVGVGGAGGLTTPAAGTTGGNTTVTSPAITCNGGVGGAFLAVGSTLVPVAGGAGGAVSTGGDINFAGSGGQGGVRLSGTAALSGSGGASHFGGAAVGLAAAGVGTTAGNYGSGGAGGLSTSTANAGGAGSQGIIIVWEFK